MMVFHKREIKEVICKNVLCMAILDLEYYCLTLLAVFTKLQLIYSAEQWTFKLERTITLTTKLNGSFVKNLL